MRLILFVVVLLAVAPARAQDTVVYREAPLRTVIDAVQEATGYRFLYRDAVVAGERITLEAAPPEVLDVMRQVLQARGLAMQVDHARRQVLLYAEEREETRLLRGQVVDAESGAPLPFATVSWHEGGRLVGTTTDESGVFRVALPQVLDDGVLDLAASFVGYRPARVHVDGARVPAELTIRLRPSVVPASEVVVTGSALHTFLDSSFHRLVQPGLFATLGEPSVVRSLQPLPAVMLTGAMSRGLSVRGSKADGFQVLLDGIPIYNQQHLFGLFDAFNASALQTVGFYYDVAPATYFAPPGGTLAYVTRAGSQQALHAEAGLTNTAAHATLEGPLPVPEGSGSWLVSGRHSYLNAVDWLGSADLIQQGLDVGGATDRTAALANDERIFFPEAPTARFYDVHGRGYWEQRGGARWSVTAYAGGDEARQEGERLVRVAGQGPRTELDRIDVTTHSRWGNEAAGVRHQQPVGERLIVHSLLAGTRYHSRYRKDDFVYTRRHLPTGTAQNGVLQSAIHPFLNENELREGTWEQRADWMPRGLGTWALGYAWHYVDVTYAEESVLRTGYRQRTTSHQADLFAQYDLTRLAALDLHLGLRTHYFSQGGYLRLSPRVRVHLGPQRPLSVGLGYSRNHQFLHRLYLRTTTSADVWVMTTPGQPPASVDHVTAGLYARPTPAVLLQLEGYVKTSRNLRQHEINTPAGDTPALVRSEPWFWDNTAYARGLEAMYRQRLGAVSWMAAYTLARVELQNEAAQGGARYPADWDRRHQLTTVLDARLGRSWTGEAAWLYASGAPNDLARFSSTEPERLDAYHRLDVSLRYTRRFGRSTLDVAASVFNVYDRENPWYRTAVAVLDTDQRPRRITFVSTDVYDLGRQPSFSVTVQF